MSRTLNKSQRRHLITIGSPECPNISRLEPLKLVETDIERIKDIFTRENQGYTFSNTASKFRKPKSAIESAISNWFSDEPHKKNDYVIVYISGHADQAQDSNHYLFTLDSEEDRPSETAIKTSELIEKFFQGKGERPSILLILDVCHAGQGAAQIETILAHARGQRKELTNGSNFWVISAVNNRTLAADGAFVDALQSAMEDLSWMSEEEDFIDLYKLQKKVNELLKKNKDTNVQAMQIEIHPCGSQSQPPFILNPKLSNISSQELIDSHLKAKIGSNLEHLPQEVEAIYKYKRLHKDLHDLNEVYSNIEKTAQESILQKNLPYVTKKRAKENIAKQLESNHKIIDDIDETIKSISSSSASNEPSFGNRVGSLKESYESLQQIISGIRVSGERLNDALSLLGKEIKLGATHASKCINEKVRNLHLNELLQDLKKIQILKDGHFQQCVEEFGRLVLPLNELCGIHDNWQEFSERLNATQMKKSDIESILGKYEKLNKMNLNIDLEDSESQQTINDYLKLLEKNENQYSDLKKAMKKRIKVDLEPSFDKFCRGFMNSFGELDELILTTIYYFMAKINNLSYEIRISL